MTSTRSYCSRTSPVKPQTHHHHHHHTTERVLSWFSLMLHMGQNGSLWTWGLVESWPNAVLHYPGCRWVSQNWDVKLSMARMWMMPQLPQGPPSFSPLGPFPLLSSFAFITAFCGWLLSSASCFAFQWDAGGCGWSFALSQPRVAVTLSTGSSSEPHYTAHLYCNLLS